MSDLRSFESKKQQIFVAMAVAVKDSLKQMGDRAHEVEWLSIKADARYDQPKEKRKAA